MLLANGAGVVFPQQGGVEFVGGRVVTTSPTIVLPSGTQVGDLVLVAVSGGGQGSGGGLTWTGSFSWGASTSIYGYKVLTSISNFSISHPSFGHNTVLVFRNATSISRKGIDTTGSTTHVVSGFTKAGDSGYVVAHSMSRNQSEPAIVSGWEDSGAGGTVSYYGAQMSLLPTASYNGNAVTIPVGSASDSAGALLEVT